MNWTARKHVHTRFKLLHNVIIVQHNSNLFENRQTVTQNSRITPHTIKQFAQHKLLRKILTVCGVLKGRKLTWITYRVFHNVLRDYKNLL